VLVAGVEHCTVMETIEEFVTATITMAWLRRCHARVQQRPTDQMDQGNARERYGFCVN
jgi:hypothetical protein